MRSRAIASPMVAAALTLSGCSFGGPVADVDEAQERVDAIVEALGVEPDSRDVLERTNGPIYALADTVMVRWEDFPARGDPLQVFADALDEAGFQIARQEEELGEGRPNSGELDFAEVVGCLPHHDPGLGAQVSIGRVAGPQVAVAVEVGGTPATSGCDGFYSP